MTANIKDIREGVAEFAQCCGISQVEAACELLLIFAWIAENIESGMTPQEAADVALKTFEDRWPEAFKE